MLYIVVDDLLRFAKRHSALTGIQRVVVEMVKRLGAMHGYDQVRLLTWNKFSGYVSYSCRLFTPDYVYDQKEFCSYFGVSRIPVYPIMNTYLTTRSAALTTALSGRRLRGKNDIEWVRTFAPRDFAKVNSPAQTAAKPFVPAKNVTVYIPGAYWSPTARQLLSMSKNDPKRPKIVGQLHDLTPLATPEFVRPRQVRNFNPPLIQFVRSADMIIADSDHTLKELRDFAAQNGLQIPPAAVVGLAQEFPSLAPAPRELSNAVRYVRRFPYVLAVGFLHGRKNNWSLVRVWQQLDRELGVGTPLLVLAGTKDEPHEALERLLAATGNLYGLVHPILAPSDGELASLYQNCLFTAYPSFYEGWGLPVGESLWFGKPVITSRSSSLPEVGGDLADYFDIADPTSLLSLCRKMIVDPAYRAQRAARIEHDKLRTWDQVARETVEALALG